MLKDLNQFDSQVEADTTTFLAILRRQVIHLIKQPWLDIQKEIEVLGQTLQEENNDLVVDKPSKSHLARSSLLLSAYRVLTHLIDDRTLLLEGLYEAFYHEQKRGVEDYLVERLGISYTAPEEAFGKASVNFKEIGDKKFGCTYIYDREVLDKTKSINVIRKCFFNDFFRANNALELLPLLCAGDDLWMDELNKAKYGVKTFRTTLLSKGDDGCRFHIIKVNP
jgi:hypothetical protein